MRACTVAVGLLLAGASALAQSLERTEKPTEFRPKDFQWSVFGLGGFGEDVERVTEERIEKTTRTISETRTVFVPVPTTHYVFVLRPIPHYVPVTVITYTKVLIPTRREITEARKVRRSKDVTSIQGFGGAGVDAKYFLTRNFGLGLAGEWASGSSDFGTLKATVTARFPMGSNAPYLYGGAGAMFANETKAIGVLGVGFEHRLTARASTFVDAGWMFTDEENAAVFRFGFSFVR